MFNILEIELGHSRHNVSYKKNTSDTVAELFSLVNNDNFVL